MPRIDARSDQFLPYLDDLVQGLAHDDPLELRGQTLSTLGGGIGRQPHDVAAHESQPHLHHEVGVHVDGWGRDLGGRWLIDCAVLVAMAVGLSGHRADRHDRTGRPTLSVGLPDPKLVAPDGTGGAPLTNRAPGDRPYTSSIPDGPTLADRAPGDFRVTRDGS